MQTPLKARFEFVGALVEVVFSLLSQPTRFGPRASLGSLSLSLSLSRRHRTPMDDLPLHEIRSQESILLAVGQIVLSVHKGRAFLP